MVEMILRYLMLVLTAGVYCHDMELKLSGYEYRRIVNKPLHLGKCPYRIVQYPEAVVRQRCTFSDREGNYSPPKQKKFSFTKLSPVNNASQVIKLVGMCDDKSANYFGLLAEGDDCIANVIASKLSFTHKTSTWMFREQFRTQSESLRTSDVFDDIQDEFTHHLNNSYYTKYISYGTHEILLVEMHFKTPEESYIASSNNHRHQRMSHKMETVGKPRKVKVIRFSSAENVLEVKTFRGGNSYLEALQFVKHCEKLISRTVQEIASGWKEPHLMYGFKAYEIDRPISLALSTITEADKRAVWESVALLQVDAKRTFTTNKRYRKFCKHQRTKYCVQMRQSIKQLKETITKIHTQRRDWMKISYDQQVSFVKKGKTNVKLLKTRIIILAKELRKMMKKKS